MDTKEKGIFMKEHILLKAKDEGECRSLTGKVMLAVILVDDAESSWKDKNAVVRIKKIVENAARIIEKKASDLEVNLEIHPWYYQGQTRKKVEYGSSDQWVSDVLKQMGYFSVGAMQQELKKILLAKEVAVMFVFHKRGRSFAYQETKSSGITPEFSVLFEIAEKDLLHELLHQFGAVDLYYPKLVEKAANQYLPESIMGRNGEKIDSFTAYLIGWTDYLSMNSKKFLDQTALLGEKEMRNALEQETKSSRGTVTYSNGEYKGELKYGMPHGRGIMVFVTGDRYEGDWQHGLQHGKGKVIYTNGTICEGEWFQGEMGEFIICRYSNGAVYEGQWKYGQPHGKGKMKYSNGMIYSGMWREGKFIH